MKKKGSSIGGSIILLGMVALIFLHNGTFYFLDFIIWLIIAFVVLKVASIIVAKIINRKKK